jgi:hypothetical protein
MRDPARIARRVRWFNRALWIAAAYAFVAVAYSLAEDGPAPSEPTGTRRAT